MRVALQVWVSEETRDDLEHLAERLGLGGDTAKLASVLIEEFALEYINLEDELRELLGEQAREEATSIVERLMGPTPNVERCGRCGGKHTCPPGYCRVIASDGCRGIQR